MNMTVRLAPQKMLFRGRSGRATAFERISPDAPWARDSGVAIFAAPDACGWRVLRVVELSGRAHDVQPIWALAEAERYGASAVFIHREADPDTRAALAEDIETGFSPVMKLVRLAA
jgi:hypothetical protein